MWSVDKHVFSWTTVNDSSATNDLALFMVTSWPSGNAKIRFVAASRCPSARAKSYSFAGGKCGGNMISGQAIPKSDERRPAAWFFLNLSLHHAAFASFIKTTSLAYPCLYGLSTLAFALPMFRWSSSMSVLFCYSFDSCFSDIDFTTPQLPDTGSRRRAARAPHRSFPGRRPRRARSAPANDGRRFQWRNIDKDTRFWEEEHTQQSISFCFKRFFSSIF